MPKSAPLLIWALILLVGAAAAGFVSRSEPRRAVEAVAPVRALTVAEIFARAQLEAPPRGAERQRKLIAAAGLQMPPAPEPPPAALAQAAAQPWLPHVVDNPPPAPSEATIQPPDGAAKLLRTAMTRAPGLVLEGPHVPAVPRGTALAALDAIAPPSGGRLGEGVSAYGELEPDIFALHRLTVLQLGDSHTAADLFTGHVRERLQQVFGSGGDAYVVPGKPHVGVRSALFDSDASDGWSYEALQKSDARKRFYLSGFNAVAHHAGASLVMRSRGGRSYDRLEVAFLKQPGGGRAEVLLDGEPGGEIDLDGAADERATLDLNANAAGAAHGFHEISVKALTDAAVTVTGVEVGREGDGVSISIKPWIGCFMPFSMPLKTTMKTPCLDWKLIGIR